MENEFQKMQRLAGVPVTEDKKQLDENFVGMSVVGNIFDREKTDYEMAFEHFLGKKYINEDETSMNIKYHGEKKGLDEYGRGKYDRKVGTYKGKYPIYQDDEGNNYIKTGSGIKDVEDLDQSQVKINK